MEYPVDYAQYSWMICDGAEKRSVPVRPPDSDKSKGRALFLLSVIYLLFSLSLGDGPIYTKLLSQVRYPILQVSSFK